MIFKYDELEIILMENTNINGTNYSKGENISIERLEAKKLIEENKAFENNKFWYSKEIKRGLNLQILLSILIIIAINLLIIFGINILIVGLIIQSFYFMLILFSLLIKSKMKIIKKKNLLYLSILTLVPFFWFRKGKFITKEDLSDNTRL